MSESHAPSNPAPCPFCAGTDLRQTEKIVQEHGEATAGPPLHEGLGFDADDEWLMVCGDYGAMGPMSRSAEEA